MYCFDAYMASLDNKELAYSNVIEITREKTEEGFVPNFAASNGVKSRDRSQPPVGSMVLRELYRKFHDKWLLEELFDDIYDWNTWYCNNRSLSDGTFAWGLTLTSLFIMDCEALSDIADILGRSTEASSLRDGKEQSQKGLAGLWNDEFGLFLNKRTNTGEFSYRISPTNFNALYSNKVSQHQAERMIKEHLYNREEFWGEWVIPSISRNDPAYPDQDYWRDRIWAPMDFLVYLALRRFDLKDVRKDLSEKSKDLILMEWMKHGHVHENYCGNTGEGCNKDNSDKFYHWGALLSMIALMEDEYVEGPENPI